MPGTTVFRGGGVTGLGLLSNRGQIGLSDLLSIVASRR
jgi:hypothetical protein